VIFSVQKQTNKQTKTSKHRLQRESDEFS
jgi:hypothetical protein